MSENHLSGLARFTTGFTKSNISQQQSNHRQGKTNLSSDEKLIKINHFYFPAKTIDKYNDSIESNKLVVNVFDEEKNSDKRFVWTTENTINLVYHHPCN